jgi:hypothetical protein
MVHPPTIIAGTVRDADGKPVAGARVFFAEGPVALPDIAALTDENGAYTLSAPVAGRYLIKCVVEGQEPVTVEMFVDVGARQDIEIRVG